MSNKACPCLHTAPCHRQCTCVVPHSDEIASLHVTINDLSFIIRRFLRKHPEYDQHKVVWEYLGRHGLQGSVLREEV